MLDLQVRQFISAAKAPSTLRAYQSDWKHFIFLVCWRESLTAAGYCGIRWDDSAAVTAMGQMPVFIDFLKTSGLWDGFVADCPLRYTSPKRTEPNPAFRSIFLKR